MSRKRYTPEQIIRMLRDAEVLLSQGRKTGEVCRRLGISEQAPGRAAQWRDLLYLEGGKGADRTMATAL